MDPYIVDWLNLILRFLHLVTGIAWIGASFYFIWLDNHLLEPPQWKSDKGIKGDLWAIHGGGFYEVSKYRLAPAVLPEILHWFKWEAYSTWITGFLLLSLMYYVGARTYLIDPGVAELTQGQAVAIGIAAIIGGWFVYDFLCNTRLANNGALLAVILLSLVSLLAFVLSLLFSARGAYIHIGAVIGTMMVGNVYRVIIPSQKALVAAVERGTEPDPQWTVKAKLRSTHNTYATLPLLFIMISGHYPITYNHTHGWLVLMIIVLITAASRQYFVLRHGGNNKPLILVAVVIATLLLAALIAPVRLTGRAMFDQGNASVNGVNKTAFALKNVSNRKGEMIIRTRCATCHSDEPSDDLFKVAPGGVSFDSLADIQQWALRIRARAVETSDMPLMNKTQMTLVERHYLEAWLSGIDEQTLPGSPKQ